MKRLLFCLGDFFLKNRSKKKLKISQLFFDLIFERKNHPNKNSTQNEYDGIFMLKNNSFLDFIIVPATLLALILFGDFGIFLGHTYFAEEDHLLNLIYNSSNSPSNGWRPDIGLGINMFWGDPGAFHTWSIFKLWSELFDHAVTAHNSSIILLL